MSKRIIIKDIGTKDWALFFQELSNVVGDHCYSFEIIDSESKSDFEPLVSLPPKRYPPCSNNSCCWNMGTKHIKGYEWLDDTCYHSTDQAGYIACSKRTS